MTAVDFDYRIEDLRPGDVTLALHAWIPAEPAAALLYVHGIQSHAGWLFETGPALAARGVALYALDRRGSGRSGGERGDARSFRDWLDDYAHAARHVRERHARIPLTILGQSMGGSIVAGLIADGRAPRDAVILCAPALGQMHARLTVEQRQALRGEIGRA